MELFFFLTHQRAFGKAPAEQNLMAVRNPDKSGFFPFRGRE